MKSSKKQASQNCIYKLIKNTADLYNGRILVGIVHKIKENKQKELMTVTDKKNQNMQQKFIFQHINNTKQTRHNITENKNHIHIGIQNYIS